MNKEDLRDKLSHKVKIETFIHDYDMIEQVVTERFNGISNEIMRLRMNTQDAHIRQALIDLGWTPPNGK